MRPLPETVVLGGGCKRRQKLKQYMLVVGDYFAEQTGIGLAQEIVKRGQISRTKAASFASAQERVHTLTVSGRNEAAPSTRRV